VTPGAGRDALEYGVAWKSLPRAARRDLVSAALRGVRPSAGRDAALTLWWSQRELRRGVWPTMAVAVAAIAILVAVDWWRTGVLPTTFGQFWTSQPLFPVFLLLPIATWGIRRPKLQRAAQVSAGVIAGRTRTDAPDQVEAQRLLDRARKSL